MLDYFGYTKNASDMPVTKEQLQVFIVYMKNLLEKHRIRNGEDYENPFYETPLEGMNVTYVDMHCIYCRCKNLMDTFDWDNFDLIFYADWEWRTNMLDKKQLNKLLFISVVYASFAEIYSVLDESPLDELPDELRDDSKNMFHEFENLLEKYNDYIQNAVDNSGLED